MSGRIISITLLLTIICITLFQSFFVFKLIQDHKEEMNSEIKMQLSEDVQYFEFNPNEMFLNTEKVVWLNNELCLNNEYYDILKISKTKTGKFRVYVFNDNKEKELEDSGTSQYLDRTKQKKSNNRVFIALLKLIAENVYFEFKPFFNSEKINHDQFHSKIVNGFSDPVFHPPLV